MTITSLIRHFVRKEVIIKTRLTYIFSMSDELVLTIKHIYLL